MDHAINFGRTSVAIDQFATQGNAVLGIRESGKSYTATYCAERLMDAGVPITVLDPVGIWRFLRVAAKGSGYPVVVCGGKHGDLPLTVGSAEEITRAAMKTGVSVVFDLFDVKLSKADWRRIVTSVVKTLHYENVYGPRHVFIEEAAEFVPQKVGPECGIVYAEVEKLVRMGGNAQLGCTLINQRAEELNKAVLELCDLLILHRQKGRRSLENLSKWLELAAPDTAKEVASLVPILKNGEAFVWPTVGTGPIRTSIPQKNTFHPDRRARQGSAVMGGGETRRIEVAEFVAKMNAELSKVLSAPLVADGVRKAIKGEPNGRVILQSEIDAKVAAAREEGHALGLLEGRAQVRRDWRAKLHPLVAAIENAVAELKGFCDAGEPALGSSPGGYGTSIVAHPTVKRGQRYMNMAAHDALEGLTAPERAVLTPLAQYGRPMEKDELAVLAGYRPNTGHFNNVVGGLRKRCLVTPDWPLGITSEGIRVLGPFESIPPKGAELVDWIKGRLKRPERVVFETAVKAYPGTLTKAQLAKQSGYEPKAGHFTNVLGRLRTMRLLTGRHDIKASEALFQ